MMKFQAFAVALVMGVLVFIPIVGGYGQGASVAEVGGRAVWGLPNNVDYATGDSMLTARSSLDSEARVMGEIEELLVRDPDVQTLIAIRDEMTQRVIELQVAIDDLKAAYQAGDEDRIAALLGYSDQEIEGLRDRLDRAREAIFVKFPEIRRMAVGNPESPCEDHDCFSFLDNLLKDQTGALAEPKCRIVPFVGCLVVCTGTTPVIYWFCSMVCTCSFCEGGWVDTVCGGWF